MARAASICALVPAYGRRQGARRQPPSAAPQDGEYSNAQGAAATGGCPGARGDLGASADDVLTSVSARLTLHSGREEERS